MALYDYGVFRRSVAIEAMPVFARDNEFRTAFRGIPFNLCAVMK